jgi:3-hydroxyacyl-CoA dehydrogenase
MQIGVIGSGSIGPDLAYGFATALAKGAGGTVHLVDIRQEALDAGVERIRGYVGKGVARGKLSPKAAAAALKAVSPTTDMGALADCEYVLEAATGAAHGRTHTGGFQGRDPREACGRASSCPGRASRGW